MYYFIHKIHRKFLLVLLKKCHRYVSLTFRWMNFYPKTYKIDKLKKIYADSSKFSFNFHYPTSQQTHHPPPKINIQHTHITRNHTPQGNRGTMNETDNGRPATHHYPIYNIQWRGVSFAASAARAVMRRPSLPGPSAEFNLTAAERAECRHWTSAPSRVIR